MRYNQIMDTSSQRMLQRQGGYIDLTLSPPTQTSSCTVSSNRTTSYKKTNATSLEVIHVDDTPPSHHLSCSHEDKHIHSNNTTMQNTEVLTVDQDLTYNNMQSHHTAQLLKSTSSHTVTFQSCRNV